MKRLLLSILVCALFVIPVSAGDPIFNQNNSVRSWLIGVGIGGDYSSGNWSIFDETAGQFRFIIDTNGYITLPILAGSGTGTVAVDNNGKLTWGAGGGGLVNFTGPSVIRTKTVRDANDTFLELGGSYTPTGTWNWGTATVTWPTFNQNTSGTAAGLSGTPALPNGTTATTQSAGDNSTKVGTTAYVDAKVSDTAYNESSWNGVTGIAPSKNAVRDYLESKIATGSDGTYGLTLSNNTTRSPTASAYELYPDGGIWKMNTNGTETTIADLSGTQTLTNKSITSLEVDGSADANLTAAQVSSTIITNYGQAASDVALTLPTAAAGYNALFVVGTAQSNKWGVRAGTNDKIYLIAADGTVTAGSDNGYARMTAAQVGQSFACWTFKTGSSAYDWQCKAISIGTSTFAAN